jgi:transmembrane sensor
VEALTRHEKLAEASGSQLTSAVISEWRAWYADPDNRRLFEQLTRLVSDARAQPQPAACINRDIDADDYDLGIPIETWRSRSLSRRAPRHRLSLAKWRSLVVAGVVAMVMAAIAALMPQLFWSRMGADGGGGLVIYQTDVGGLQDVALADGSKLILGGRTTVVVSFASSGRSVNLVRGEAWFNVAHVSNWPFVVHAGDGAIRDIGTAFLVRRDSDRVVVTVTEGAVTVSTASLLVPAPIRVVRGEQVSYHDNGVVASVARADADVSTAWTHGRLIFDDEPLRYVIEDVNRYSRRQISASPSAGKFRFSGVILDGKIEEWLHGLSDIIPVDIDEHGAVIRIGMRGLKKPERCPASR